MNTSARMIPVAAVTMTLVLGLSACSVLPKAAPMVTYKLPDYHIAQAESTPRAVPGPALRVYAPESSRVLIWSGCSLRSPMVACRLGKECVGPTPHRCCCVTESSKPSCAMGGRLP